VRVVFRMRNTHAPPGTRTTTNTKTYLDVFLFRYDLQEVFRAREAPPRESVQATGNFVAFRISRGFAKPDHPRAPPSVLRLNLHQPAHHRVRRVVVLGRRHRAAKIPPARKRTRVTGRLAMHSNCGVPEAYRDSYSYLFCIARNAEKRRTFFRDDGKPPPQSGAKKISGAIRPRNGGRGDRVRPGYSQIAPGKAGEGPGKYKPHVATRRAVFRGDGMGT